MTPEEDEHDCTTAGHVHASFDFKSVTYFLSVICALVELSVVSHRLFLFASQQNTNVWHLLSNNELEPSYLELGEILVLVLESIIR